MTCPAYIYWKKTKLDLDQIKCTGTCTVSLDLSIGLKCRCPFLLNSWLLPMLHWTMSLVFQFDNWHHRQLQLQYHPPFLDPLVNSNKPNPFHLNVMMFKWHKPRPRPNPHHSNQQSKAFWPPKVPLRSRLIEQSFVHLSVMFLWDFLYVCLQRNC